MNLEASSSQSQIDPKSWKRLWIAIIFMAVFLVSGELISRSILTGPWTAPADDPGLFREAQPPGELPEMTPGFKGKYGRQEISINSKGLRGPEISCAKAPGEFRVLLLGDSFAFGYGVPYEETLGALLENRLTASAPPSEAIVKYTVINAGFPSFDAQQEIEYYMRRGRLFSPDIVLIYHNYNDLVPQEDLPYHVTKTASRTRFPLHAWLAPRSYFYNLIHKRAIDYAMSQSRIYNKEALEAEAYKKDLPYWKPFAEEMAKLRDAARADGAALVLAAYNSSKYRDIDYNKLRVKPAPSFSEKEEKFLNLKSLAEELGIGFVNPLENLSANAPLSVEPLNPHPSGALNRQAAITIADRLLEMKYTWPTANNRAETVEWTLLASSKDKGWSGAENGLTEYGVYGLWFESGGSDPQICNPGIDLQGNRLGAVEFEMRVIGQPSRQGQFFWSPGESWNYSEQNSVRFDLLPNDDWNAYTIFTPQLQSLPDDARIRGLRLDPIEAPGRGAIRNLRIILANPAGP